MLFAAGMGSGLIFWGVAEPALNVVNSPLKHTLYPDKVSSALALTLVNWGGACVGSLCSIWACVRWLNKKQSLQW